MDKYKWVLPGDKLIRNEFMTELLDSGVDLVCTSEEFESHFNKWKEEQGYKLNHVVE